MLTFLLGTHYTLVPFLCTSHDVVASFYLGFDSSLRLQPLLFLNFPLKVRYPSLVLLHSSNDMILPFLNFLAFFLKFRLEHYLFSLQILHILHLFMFNFHCFLPYFIFIIYCFLYFLLKHKSFLEAQLDRLSNFVRKRGLNIS